MKSNQNQPRVCNDAKNMPNNFEVVLPGFILLRCRLDPFHFDQSIKTYQTQLAHLLCTPTKDDS